MAKLLARGLAWAHPNAQIHGEMAMLEYLFSRVLCDSNIEYFRGRS